MITVDLWEWSFQIVCWCWNGLTGLWHNHLCCLLFVLLFFSHSFCPFIFHRFLFPSMPSLVFILFILLLQWKLTFPSQNIPPKGSGTLRSSSKWSLFISLFHFFTSCIVPYNTFHGRYPQNSILFFLSTEQIWGLIPNLYLTSCVTLIYLISLSLICQYWKIRKNPCFHLITTSHRYRNILI